MVDDNTVIERVKFLYMSSCYARSIRDCARQAIKEMLKPKNLQGKFLAFDITLENYIDFIEKEIQKWLSF